MEVIEEIYRSATGHFHAGNIDTAVDDCRRILRIDPRHSAARELLSELVHGGTTVEESLLRANRLADGGNMDEAVVAYQSLLEVNPECTAAWFNLGRTLQDADRVMESADCYIRAIEIEPGFRDAGLNLGIVFRDSNRLDESLSLFEAIVAADAADAQAHLQRSLTLLAMGRFNEGWDEYEWRWKTNATRGHDERPVWDGTPIPNGTLLVHAEQGVGDEIMFASCLPDIATRVGRCIVECDPRLVPLFARSFPSCDVFPAPVVLSDIDVQIPIGSLPRLFRRDHSAFPQRDAFLVADAPAVSQWRERFSELGEGVKVGIVWQGGRKPDVRRRRSTALDQWTPILQTPQVQFVSLQAGGHLEELSGAREQSGASIATFDDVDLSSNLDALAAQIAALDLVISVDASTAHLAGGLGVPVWTLLPFAGDYRWMRETDCSPWYPSMRLFRQSSFGNWGPVFERVAAELRSLAAG